MTKEQLDNEGLIYDYDTLLKQLEDDYTKKISYNFKPNRYGEIKGRTNDTLTNDEKNELKSYFFKIQKRNKEKKEKEEREGITNKKRLDFFKFIEDKNISDRVKKTKHVKPKKKQEKKKEKKKEEKKWTMETILKQNDKEEKVFVKEAKKNKNALWFSIPLKNIMLKLKKLEKENKQETNEYVKELEKLLKFFEKNKKTGNFEIYYHPYYGKTLQKEAERIEEKDKNDEELTEYERKMYPLIVDSGEDGIDYSDFYRKTVPFGLQLDNKHDKEFNDNSSAYDFHPINIMIRQLKEMIKKIKEDLKPKEEPKKKTK